LYRDVHEGLVGWVSVQGPSHGFSFRKSICTTDRCVVQLLRQQIFWRGKTKPRKTRIGKKELRRALFPSQGGRRSMEPLAQGWYISASARQRQQERAAHTLQVTALEFSPQRKRQHTPWKVKPWNSVLNASGSRNVLIIRIIIHGFRHRGYLRAHPRCCHRLCVESNR